jgi:hypothetical protein
LGAQFLATGEALIEPLNWRPRCLGFRSGGDASPGPVISGLVISVLMIIEGIGEPLRGRAEGGVDAKAGESQQNGQNRDGHGEGGGGGGGFHGLVGGLDGWGSCCPVLTGLERGAGNRLPPLKY